MQYGEDHAQSRDSPLAEKLTFKGGTSISKVYKITSAVRARLSEWIAGSVKRALKDSLVSGNAQDGLLALHQSSFEDITKKCAAIQDEVNHTARDGQ